MTISQRRMRISSRLILFGAALAVAGLLLQAAVLIGTLAFPALSHLAAGHSSWRSLLIDGPSLVVVFVVLRQRKAHLKQQGEDRIGIEPLPLSFRRPDHR